MKNLFSRVCNSIFFRLSRTAYVHGNNHEESGGEDSGELGSGEAGSAGSAGSACLDKQTLVKIWKQASAVHEARNEFMTSIMRKCTDFTRPVAGEVEEKGTITFKYVCEHCKQFQVEGFLWGVTASHRNMPLRSIT